MRVSVWRASAAAAPLSRTRACMHAMPPFERARAPQANASACSTQFWVVLCTHAAHEEAPPLLSLSPAHAHWGTAALRQRRRARAAQTAGERSRGAGTAHEYRRSGARAWRGGSTPQASCGDCFRSAETRLRCARRKGCVCAKLHTAQHSRLFCLFGLKLCAALFVARRMFCGARKRAKTFCLRHATTAALCSICTVQLVLSYSI